MNKPEVLKRIQPIGLLPMATALTCVILASRDSDLCPGHPSLPQFLIIAGSLTFGLGILTNITKFIVVFGLPSERSLTKNEKQVVRILGYFSYLMTFCQISLLVAGTIVIGPLASTIHPWQYKDVKKEFYCDYTLVMFTAIFFPTMWLLVLLTGTAYLLIQCFSDSARTNGPTLPN